MPNVNPRKKALDAISQKIAVFYLTQTYSEGEDEARQKLNEAIGCLDKAAELLAAADEKVAADGAVKSASK